MVCHGHFIYRNRLLTIPSEYGHARKSSIRQSSVVHRRRSSRSVLIRKHFFENGSLVEVSDIS